MSELTDDQIKKMSELSDNEIKAIARELVGDNDKVLDDECLDDLVSSCSERDITTKERLTQFLSQSSRFRWTKGLASGKSYERRKDFGNDKKEGGPEDISAGDMRLTGSVVTLDQKTNNYEVDSVTSCDGSTTVPSFGSVPLSSETNITPTFGPKDTKPTTHCPIDTSVQTVKRINFMVAGQSGAGKTTMCYSTFQQHFPNFTMKPPTNGPTSKIELIGEGETTIGNETIKVTVTDAAGLDNNFDAFSHRINPVLRHIVAQNAKYEREELYRNSDDSSNDTRIHCLFYFFGSHRVHPLDITFLEILQDVVVIVPIVSKADSLTASELAHQLRLIKTSLDDANITVFDFEEEGIDESWLNQPFDAATFARLGMSMVEDQVSTESPIIVRRPTIRNVFAIISGVREYLWVTVSEKNPHHCDTMRLHTVLFRSLGMLRKKTEDIHEKWRQHNSEKSAWNVFRAMYIVAVIAAVLLGLFLFRLHQTQPFSQYQSIWL